MTTTQNVVTAATQTTSYRDAAAMLWGEAGTYCHDSYQRWLPLFPELPDEVPIVIGDDWYAAIRRLSPEVLGHQLDARRGGDRKSVRVKQADGTSVVRKIRNPDVTPHGAVARWPYSFRPADLGEPIGCPSY